MATTQPLEKPKIHIVIEPARGLRGLGLRDLWQYRELLFFLTLRDIQIRYKQTILGILWAVLQPFLTMVVFSIFFGNLAKIPSDGVPYPIFSYAGLVPWTFFANALSMASNSLVANSTLVRKVYFPRLLIPVSSVGAGLVDFVLAFSILLLLMLAYGTPISARLIALPFFVLLAMVTGLGVGLWLSTLNVQFRDVRYAIPFLTQFWLFITPIAYPSSLIENPTLRTLYALNPMAGVIEGFRWALLDTPITLGPMLIVSSLVAVALLVTGLLYFRHIERTFADII
ncbi:MAG: ABC transporter permease [Anaerolineae bacterium]|nr:ABC transporter permease [Anaerolineae bacterium]